MRHLLDTHALAWAVGDPAHLGEAAREALNDPQHQLFVSPVSVWEMSIKYSSGKWPSVAPFMDETLYGQFVETLGATELSINHRHARTAGRLEAAHKDPFDRLLVAQALLERLTLISKDEALDVFGIHRLW